LPPARGAPQRAGAPPGAGTRAWGRDPGRAAAEGAVARPMEPIRCDPEPGQHLYVGAKHGPGEIVVTGIAIAAPTHEQSGAGKLGLAGPRLGGQARRAVIRGEAEQLAEAVEEAVRVLLQPPRERMLGVEGLDLRRKTSLGTAETS